MAKQKANKPCDHDHFAEFDCSEDAAMYGHEMDDEVMLGMLSTSQHQQMIAMELTKLVVQQAKDPMGEEKVFSVFSRANKMVVENFPIQELWNKLTQH